MKCPVCGNVNTSRACLKCGFDSSRDYEKYPTFGPVGKGPAVSARRELWQQNPTPPESVKKSRKIPVWLMAAACALAMGLGIWIGTGMGKAEPAEPIESIQMQEPVETTDPVETVAPAVTEPTPTEAPVLKLDPMDVSVFTAGEVFTIYARLGTKTVDRTKITWSTSDPNIATVDNGTVTSVGKGMATITAEYDGMTDTCIVRCRFENETKPADEDREDSQNTSWRASHTDVSIDVGDRFRLTVRNQEGKTADAIWTMSEEGIVSIEGKTITGRAPGNVTLTTTVDGVTLDCIVRVS